MSTIARDQLRSAWLRRLVVEWHRLNDERLGSVLTAPTFRLHDGRQRLGFWALSTRTLSVSSEHLEHDAWEEVVGTLAHEVAHQFAHEVLGGSNEAPHGPAFRRACEKLGIESNASATPKEGPTDRIIERVRKLLALAESDNPHEAQVAMARAHRLLLKYNLELADLAGDRRFLVQRLGTSAASLSLEKKLVASILSEFFFVKCIWANHYNARRNRDERILETMGTAANVDLAAFAHDFLHAELARLWKIQRLRFGASGARMKREYCAGVLLGFRDKLRAERDKCEEEGLVWVGDASLDDAFQDAHPRTRSLSTGGFRLSAAHERGRMDGADLRLRKPIQRQGDESAPRLLPS